MRADGLGSFFAKSYSFSGINRSRSASEAQSAFISRKTEKTKDDRVGLLRGLDKKSSTVSVHSFDDSGLSEEEIHRRQVNAKRQENTFKSTAMDKAGGYLKLSQAKSSSKDTGIKKHFEYNYKDISSMIRQAKTSSTAGQAATKAKRKVLELRRKMANSSDNDEKAEISAAISHAKSMERAAKKKKHHLETEELIINTMRRDEKLSGDSTSSSGGTFAMNDLVSRAEDVVDEAYEKLDGMMQDAVDEYAGKEAEVLPDEADMEVPDLSEMSDPVSNDIETLDPVDFTDMMPEDLLEDFDKAYELLDEVMEDLGVLEAVDPHMDEESFKKLRTKHRNSEEKDLVKADMEYMKAMFNKYQQDMEKAKGMAAYGMGPTSTVGFTYSTPSVSAAAVSGLPAIDVTV